MVHILVILSICVRGILCAVDCGPPTNQVNVDRTCLQVGGVVVLTDTTEGAFVNYPCVSLLWNTIATMDYCPVEMCQSDGTWRTATLSCGSSECYNGTSSEYTGRKVCTTSGKFCQRWEDQLPHPHTYVDAGDFPDDTLADAGSSCRDPGGIRGKPWCYTVEPGTEWEDCGIPECGSKTIGQGLCPGDYCGDPDETLASDNTCIDVPAPTTDGRSKGSTIKYVCNSLLVDFTSTFSYCPVKVCSGDLWWTGANISCGSNECYTAGQSRDYQGRRTCTSEGVTCQRWDAQSPHSHAHTADSAFPDATVADAENFCRDPDGSSGEPWCYTMDPAIETQTCGVPECSSLPINSGICNVPTTTPSPTTRSPPSPQAADFGMYQKTQSSLTGYDVQYTLPLVTSPIYCARMCHQQPGCALLSLDNSKVCTLYREDPAITDPIDCSSMKCYIRNS